MSAERSRSAARWPYRAEGQRRDIRAAADSIRDLVKEAREANDDRNPHLAGAFLAMIETCTADIQRLTTEARIGPEPDDDN